MLSAATKVRRGSSTANFCCELERSKWNESVLAGPPLENNEFTSNRIGFESFVGAMPEPVFWQGVRVSLSKILESRFRGDIRFRGAAYLQDSRVEITHVTAERLYGVVQDGGEFQTQLSRSDAALQMFCTCAKPGQQEVTCKHIWATILASEKDGYIDESIRPGFYPPFVASDDNDPLFDMDGDVFEDVPGNDVYVPPSGLLKTEKLEKPVIEIPLSEWEKTLQKLRESLDEDELSNAASRDREIVYQLDLSASRDSGLLVVDVSQRQRRASGEWGKVKPLKLRPGKLEDIDHEDDRRLLALMGGGVADRSTWFPNNPEFQTANYRYKLPMELADDIVPLLCQTERFVLLDAEGTIGKPLKWDAGPVWSVRMQLVFDEELDEWTLSGRLHRDGQAETVDVRDAELIVAGGFVLRGRTLARLEDFGDYEWIKLLISGDRISVPNGEEAAFVDRLLDMPAMPELDLPEQLRLTEVTPEIKPVLTVQAPRGRWRHEKLRAEMNFDYEGTLVRGASRRFVIVQRDQGRCLVRDRHKEQAYWTQLETRGFRKLLDKRRGAHDVEIDIRGLGTAVRGLIDEGWTVNADGKQVRQAGIVKFKVNSAVDWFELHANVDFSGHTVALPELLAALQRGETTIRLGDGSLGILPEEWLEQYGLLAGLGTPDGENLRFTNTQAGLLDALLVDQTEVEYDDKFLSLRERMRFSGTVSEVVEPAEFKGSLRAYQREGVGWLKFLQGFGFGGCLADDMGLGKTVQLLALLQERMMHEDRAHCPSLIVVPKSLIFNWASESEKFTPKLRVLEYTGLERAALREAFDKHDIILTTYGTLRRDVFQLRDQQFDYVVLDEAQTIKNAASQVAKASRLLKANYRVALSGTPIENHLGDLWSIFEFLNPGMLGRSSLFKAYAQDAQDENSRGMLGKGLKPFILRRTKQQVANDLPEKVEQTIYCQMGKEQQRLYDEMREHYRNSIMGLVKDQGLAKTQMHVLEALLRLRQAACHPALLDANKIGDSSAKLDVLSTQLEELVEEGHKALVFSQFTSLLDIVKKHLDEKGIVYEYLDGSTRDRKKRVERFQSDEKCPVFLISLKAGGLGLNLTAAEYVFLLDPWWNPAVEAQAIDRAHRVGQTKRVFAYRLICKGTVEEKIAELQKQKRDLADAILQENNSMMKNLSLDDLDMLLS